jgi:hypothetical protein
MGRFQKKVYMDIDEDIVYISLLCLWKIYTYS